MSRYFFHVHDGQDQPDLEGTELPGLEAAQTEAVRFAGELLRDQAETFWSSGEWKLRVTNDSDLTLFELLLIVSESAAIMRR